MREVPGSNPGRALYDGVVASSFAVMPVQQTPLIMGSAECCQDVESVFVFNMLEMFNQATVNFHIVFVESYERDSDVRKTAPCGSLV